MPALNFAEPERLWWLLLVPLLLVLALPPRPRRVVFTAHLPQWRLALSGMRRRPPRAVSLRTWLLLLAAAVAVLAFAGLQMPGQPGPHRLVVLLDASASMAARLPGGESPWHRAHAELRTAFANLPPHIEVTLLRCGGALVRRHGASARELHDLGEPAGARTADLAQLAALCAAEDTVVWTLTDGQAVGDRVGDRGWDRGGELPTVGAWSSLGLPGGTANAAVLAVRVQDQWPLPTLQLEADVIVFAAADSAPEVRVLGAVLPVPAQRPTVSAGEVSTLRWTLVRTAAGGALHVEIGLPADALALDDRWSAVLPPLPAPRIAVLTDPEAGPFATIAAEALAAEVAGSVVPATPGAEVGLLLVDGGEVALQPGRTRALSFATRAAGAAAAPPWLRPPVVDWARNSPLCAGLDLSELRIDLASPDTLPPGEPFLWGERGGERVPLAVVSEGPDLASVHFGFRLQDSNLPLLAAFPQLLRRAFVRCYGTAAAIQVTSAPPAVGEQDLRQPGGGALRPLPAFATAPSGYGPFLMALGVLALLGRALLRAGPR